MFVAIALAGAALLGQLPVDSSLSFKEKPGRLKIEYNGEALTEFVFVDADVPRPYFAFMNSRNGIRLTRKHPPRADEAQDHIGLHTGVWLAFGDISGNDYWRLKAKVEHAGFVEKPQVIDKRVRWTVRNRYKSTDGSSTVCEEVCEYTVEVLGKGWLLTTDSVFRSDAEFSFGQQDEMGLGVRVPTAMAVKSGQGGRIVDSAGRKNEKEIWGTNADWVDYGGIVGDRQVGLAILSYPGNPHPSWHHARDYGFVAANPFPRDVVKTTIPAGEEFRLQYAVYVYDFAADENPNVGDVYRLYSLLVP